MKESIVPHTRPLPMKRSLPLPECPTREWKMTPLCSKPSLTLVGYSRSADRTFFHVPELRLGLDAGETRGRQPQFICLTHSHIDHSKALPYMLLREHGCVCYCPKEAETVIERFLRAEIELNTCGNLDEAMLPPYRLEGVSEGSSFSFGDEKGVLVEVVKCIHAVPCVGYLFSQKRSKLKEEYRGKPSKEIASLRSSGVVVMEEIREPLFAYLGDTGIDVFNNPRVFDFPVIVVECTFLYWDEMIEDRCRRDGHICWKHLEPVVTSHPHRTFILIHFSCRYKEEEIYEFFESMTTRGENPLCLDNVVLHVNGMSEGRHSQKGKSSQEKKEIKP